MLKPKFQLISGGKEKTPETTTSSKIPSPLNIRDYIDLFIQEHRDVYLDKDELSVLTDNYLEEAWANSLYEAERSGAQLLAEMGEHYASVSGVDPLLPPVIDHPVSVTDGCVMMLGYKKKSLNDEG